MNEHYSYRINVYLEFIDPVIDVENIFAVPRAKTQCRRPEVVRFAVISHFVVAELNEELIIQQK